MYRYPTSEEKTDSVEASLDPYKRERERLVIRSMLCSDWKLALDFGCGTGRNFELFAFPNSPAKPRSLFGVEPDQTRLAESRAVATQNQEYFDSLSIFSSIDELDKFLDGKCLFDVILVCQVFGHVSTDKISDILSALADRLTVGGALIICIPFHIGMATGDFYHYVGLESVNNGKIHRVTISEDDFNQLADSPRKDILHVRAFELQHAREDIGAHALPICVFRPPLADSLSALKAAACLVYSIHERFEDNRLIGDLIVKFVK